MPTFRFHHRLLAVAVLTSLSACRQNYTVSMGDQPSATAHYVIVKTNWRGKMRVFDCQSQPKQTDWDPTCKQVKMQSSVGELIDDTWQRVHTGGSESGK